MDTLKTSRAYSWFPYLARETPIPFVELLIPILLKLLFFLFPVDPWRDALSTLRLC